MTNKTETQALEAFMSNPYDQLLGILNGSDDLENDCKLFVTRNQEILLAALATAGQQAQGGDVDIPSLHSKIDMDCEDEYGREITTQESVAIGTAMKLLGQQGFINTQQPEKDRVMELMAEALVYLRDENIFKDTAELYINHALSEYAKVKGE